MCDQAQLGCACKVRIASLGSAAAGGGVAAVAIFVVGHLVLVAVALGVLAVAAGAGALAVRRSARLAVVHWPALAAAHKRELNPVAARAALPAPARVLHGVIVHRHRAIPAAVKDGTAV